MYVPAVIAVTHNHLADYLVQIQNMPFDEDPEDPVHVRIRKRLDQPFDSDLLFDIGISEQGQPTRGGSVISHELIAVCLPRSNRNRLYLKTT